MFYILKKSEFCFNLYLFLFSRFLILAIYNVFVFIVRIVFQTVFYFKKADVIRVFLSVFFNDFYMLKLKINKKFKNNIILMYFKLKSSFVKLACNTLTS